jgi:hypothetical protein
MDNKKYKLPREGATLPEDHGGPTDTEGHALPDGEGLSLPGTGGDFSPRRPSSGGELIDDNDVQGHNLIDHGPGTGGDFSPRRPSSGGEFVDDNDVEGHSE